MTFTSTAAGNPAPSVQWQKLPLDETTWVDIADATQTSLTFIAFHVDIGHYRAVFTNALGQASSNAAELTMTLPPP